MSDENTIPSEWLRQRVLEGHDMAGTRLIEIAKGRGAQATPDEARTLACMALTFVTELNVARSFHEHLLRQVS